MKTTSIITAFLSVIASGCSGSNSSTFSDEATGTAQVGGGMKSQEQSIVGVWIDHGKHGLSGKTNEVALLELRRNGEFAWVTEDLRGRVINRSRKGKYSVEDSHIRFEFAGERAFTNSVAFVIKGRTLLLQRTDSSSGISYHDYLYRREEADDRNLAGSKQRRVADVLKANLSFGGSLRTALKEFRTFNSEGTYMEWTLDLSVTNSLPFDIRLGNMLIVAQVPEEGPASGFVRVRGDSPVAAQYAAPENPSSSYFLDDFDSTDGGSSIYVDGARFVFNGSGAHPPHSGFGAIRHNTVYAFFEEVRPGTWLKDEAIVGVQVVLPEFVIQTPGGVERFHAILSLQKNSQEGKPAEWIYSNVEYVPVQPEYLRSIIANPGTTLFQKILAVNWLVASDPAKGGNELAKILDPKKGGYLLAAGLKCYIDRNLPGFEKQAIALEDNENTASAIQKLATEYLDVRKVDRGLMKLSNIDSAEKTERSGDDDRARLDERNWVALKLTVPKDLWLRRLETELGGVGNNQTAAVLHDNNDLPGSKMADLSGGGGDFRGRIHLKGGQTYWLVLSRDNEQSRLASWWKRCPANSIFPKYALSTDGGQTWRPSRDDAALQTTIWYTER